MSLAGWCLFILRELGHRHARTEPITFHVFTSQEWWLCHDFDH